MTNIIIEDFDPDFHAGPVTCDDCGTNFPESALHNGICAGCCFKRPNYWDAELDAIRAQNDSEWTDDAENEPDELPDDDVYRGEGDLEC